jgi:hypothetical protein
MSTPALNRKRIFADVVTVDAWHPTFSVASPTVDLHADVVFRVARLGAETDSPVRFRLAIKRAEVVVVIPPNEPVGILKASVAREQSIRKGTLTKSVDVDRTLQAGVKGQTKINISNIQAGLEGQTAPPTTHQKQNRISNQKIKSISS